MQVRDLAEQLELLECSTAVPSSAELALPGRTTGSLEWRQQRGETGVEGHGMREGLQLGMTRMQGMGCSQGEMEWRQRRERQV